MSNEKYGFVYVWHNTKKKRFYVGCHWGREDDGYICSSNTMRNSYSRNKEFFKRRVIQRIYTNRQDLLEAEFKWLDQIKDSELGKKYYNLSKRHFGHWSTSVNEKSVREKCSIGIKKAHAAGKFEASKQLRLDALKRRGESWRKNSSKKTAEMNRNRVYTDETRAKMKRTGEQNAWTGKIWITNGSESTRISKDQMIPPGWRKGRIRGHKK